MKKLSARLLSLLIAVMMVLSCFVACADTDTPEDETTGETEAAGSEAATQDAKQAALDELGDIDFGGEALGILYEDGFTGEVFAENEIVDNSGGDDQIINDAVYQRNVLLEERCKLVVEPIAATAATITTSVQNAATGGTGDVHLIDTTLLNSANFSVSGFLYNYLDLDVDIEREWWDIGTADFELDGRVYFMSGDVNFGDDNMTYVLLFNKKMAEEYSKTVENPYQTVLNWEWTLDHFNTIIQGISSEDGDGTWNEKDKYGFVTTYEFGNTLFIGSDLRYIVNDVDTGLPTLFLADGSKMEKALDVLEMNMNAIYAMQNYLGVE